MTDVLLCTDTFWAANTERLRAIAPTLEVVPLTDEPVSDEDLARITLAFFSHDAWPERAPSFFGAATRAPNLAWLHTMSAGVDSPVFTAFLERGAQLTTSSGSSAAPIARSVMMYLLALARNLPQFMRAQSEGRWEWQRWTELAGQRVAVVGFGPIGQEVVRLCAAFGMEPVVVRRAAKGDEPCEVHALSDLHEVVASVDALVLALPLNDDTRGLIGADVIAALPSHALVVNVGRGELIDQEALTDALRDGTLGGAGLDVTTPEPLPSDHPLWTLPNVIITPHNSGSTDGTARRAAECFFRNLEARVNGEPFENEVML